MSSLGIEPVHLNLGPATGGALRPGQWGYVPPPPPPHASWLGNIEHIGGQFVDDLVNSLKGSAGAAVHAVPYIFTHNPEETLFHQVPRIAGAMYHQTLADFAHPLRHPGYTALDLASLLPIPGAAVGRAVEMGAILGRAGELSARLAEATRPFLAAGDFDKAAEAARNIGKEGEFTKAFKKDPETGRPVPRGMGAQLRTTMLAGPAREGRLLKGPNGEMIPGWHFSRDPTIKMAQKLVDRAYDAFPDGRPPNILRAVPGFWRTQGGRLKSATRQTNLAAAANMGADAAAFWRKFGGIHDTFHLIGRMIPTGTTADEVRSYYQDILNGSYKPETRVPHEIQMQEAKRILDLLDKAEPYLQNVTHHITSEPGVDEAGNAVTHPWTGQSYPLTVPTLKPEFQGTQLGEYIDAIKRLSKEREVSLEHSGALQEDSAISRIIAPKHEMMYRDLPYYGEHLDRMKASLAGIERLHGGDSTVWQQMRDRIQAATEKPPIPQDVAEKLINQADLVRIHYDIPPARKFRAFTTADFRRRRAYKATRQPTPPGTLTHPFGAEIMRAGGGDINTARVMAATSTEAARYIALHNNWLRIAGNLQDYADKIPLRFRTLVRRPPGDPQSLPDPMTRTETERFIARTKEQANLTKEQADALGLQYEQVRQGLFPKNIFSPIEKAMVSVKSLASKADIEKAPPGYGWADSRLLGGLDKTNPLITMLHDYPVARYAVKGIDAINTINKFALLYLKPAYIIPNALGNVAMNLVQQGFMAPVNLGKSLYLWNRSTPEVREALLSAIQEGGSRVISENPTVGGKLIDLPEKLSRGAGKFYGRIVDTPFRIASLLHEARVDGITSMSELRSLLTDPKQRDHLNDLTSRANDAIINFELMDPYEQAIMRRLIFFYPWIKGSTRYTANLYKEHPLAFGAQAMAGHQESQRQEDILGDIPPWARGLVPWGRPDAQGNVDVSNPQAFSILGTPASVLEEAHNIFQRNPDASLAALGEMGPAERMGLDILSGGATAQQRSKSGAAVNAPFMTALQDYVGGNPVKLFVERLLNQQKPTSVYANQSWIRDLLMFAGPGTLTPRKFRDALARYYQFQHEQNPAFYG